MLPLIRRPSISSGVDDGSEEPSKPTACERNHDVARRVLSPMAAFHGAASSSPYAWWPTNRLNFGIRGKRILGR